MRIPTCAVIVIMSVANGADRSESSRFRRRSERHESALTLRLQFEQRGEGPQTTAANAEGQTTLRSAVPISDLSRNVGGEEDVHAHAGAARRAQRELGHGCTRTSSPSEWRRSMELITEIGWDEAGCDSFLNSKVPGHHDSLAGEPGNRRLRRLDPGSADAAATARSAAPVGTSTRPRPASRATRAGRVSGPLC